MCRAACFDGHFEIVKYLVEHNAGECDRQINRQKVDRQKHRQIENARLGTWQNIMQLRQKIYVQIDVINKRTPRLYLDMSIVRDKGPGF